MIAEGDIVVVKQIFIGTHKKQFQNIPPTGKTVSVEGIATYNLQNGKVIHSQVQTDRLGFLRQLCLLPADISKLSSKKETANTLYFIDRFFVLGISIKEFVKQMNYNGAF